MKGKGFLKKMIGALCAVGVLISIPVTVYAADKKDVLGEWDGNTPAAPYTFYENGYAEDSFNIRPYWMESGSLTIKYMRTGETETVDYDLWRGERIKNVSVDEYEDAVIFKIIEPGKMQAWNVAKEKNSSEWVSYDSVILTKVEHTARKCEHHYEWAVTTEPTETEDGVSSYICTSCGDVEARQPISASVAIRNNLLAAIKNAEAGTTVTFDNQAWLCYPQYVLDALKEKGNVSLKTDFTYGGVNYSFIIPAGSDYTNLEPADFYGFMYLLGAFDGTIVQ